MSETTKPDARKTHLSRANNFKLMTWLSCQRDRLQNQRLRVSEIAAECAKELGFAVSKGNVSGALADLEIKLPRAPAERKGGAAYIARERERIDALTVRVEQLEGRLAETERQLRQAHTRLTAVEGEVAPFAAVPANGSASGVCRR